VKGKVQGQQSVCQFRFRAMTVFVTTFRSFEKVKEWYVLVKICNLISTNSSFILYQYALTLEAESSVPSTSHIFLFLARNYFASIEFILRMPLRQNESFLLPKFGMQSEDIQIEEETVLSFWRPFCRFCFKGCEKKR
jgi:hypothetical protein